MAKYRVDWSVDVEVDSDDPVDAAVAARGMMLDPERMAIADFYIVRRQGHSPVTVDLAVEPGHGSRMPPFKDRADEAFFLLAELISDPDLILAGNNSDLWKKVALFLHEGVEGVT